MRHTFTLLLKTDDGTMVELDVIEGMFPPRRVCFNTLSQVPADDNRAQRRAAQSPKKGRR